MIFLWQTIYLEVGVAHCFHGHNAKEWHQNYGQKTRDPEWDHLSTPEYRHEQQQVGSPTLLQHDDKSHEKSFLINRTRFNIYRTYYLAGSHDIATIYWFR